uniref:Uncharacterized protein n=1 Tax=Desulfobacca acetoxidans TaxID=60893 RepID=A0A7C3YZS9_9BACT
MLQFAPGQRHRGHNCAPQGRLSAIGAIHSGKKTGLAVKMGTSSEAGGLKSIEASHPRLLASFFRAAKIKKFNEDRKEEAGVRIS